MLRRWAVVGALALIGCESLRKPAPPTDEVASRNVGTTRNESAGVPLTRVSHPARLDLSPLGRGGGSRASLQQPEKAVTPTSPRRGEVAAACEARQAGEGTAITHAITSPSVSEPDHLTLVAECLGRGDRAGAVPHLEAYVRRHPEQLMFRLQLAELLAQLGRDAHAKPHYEQFVLDARHAGAAVKAHLVHAHTQLMDIGLRQGDRFAELFHRGVGLLLLAAEEDGRVDADPAFGEEMLCKALKSLAEAKELKPNDARVRLHLADAYERTGNRRAAGAERAAGRGAVVPEGAGLVLPR